MQLINLSSATKDKLFSSLGGKYNESDFLEALNMLEEKILENGIYSSIKLKDDSYTLTSSGKKLFSMIREHKDIGKILQEQKQANQQKLHNHSNNIQADETKGLILEILCENESLELGEIITLAM